MPGLDHRVVLRPLLTVVSASWLYPFKGIYFYATHRAWWPLFGRRLIPLMLVSILVFGFLFTFAYLPQVALLAIFHGPAAFLNATFLVLGEGQVIIALLFEALFVDETLVDVFDAVLIQEGLIDLVEPTRAIDHEAPTPVKMLGKPTISAVYSPFSFRQIFEFTIFLPLNFIPYVGVPAFIVVTGARAGPLAHWRYFKMRSLNKKERNNEIRTRRWKYTWFGSVALLLQLIPVLSMLFLLTSAAGSALWASQIEKTRRELETAPSQPTEVFVEDEAPPPYTDNPL
ncbi:MAG: hypothetical protein M1818_000544 [Claussenomyces sp. TS43310]|nr:MAG: hypothetical protein M1818_000544 [Claussenomyces sp. TS43310]